MAKRCSGSPVTPPSLSGSTTTLATPLRGPGTTLSERCPAPGSAATRSARRFPGLDQHDLHQCPSHRCLETGREEPTFPTSCSCANTTMAWAPQGLDHVRGRQRRAHHLSPTAGSWPAPRRYGRGSRPASAGRGTVELGRRSSEFDATQSGRAGSGRVARQLCATSPCEPGRKPKATGPTQAPAPAGPQVRAPLRRRQTVLATRWPAHQGPRGRGKGGQGRQAFRTAGRPARRLLGGGRATPPC